MYIEDLLKASSVLFQSFYVLLSLPVDTSFDTGNMPGKPAPAYVLGVGMTKFIKPRGKVDCKSLVKHATSSQSTSG